jgi:CDP-diglyceride synthetase
MAGLAKRTFSTLAIWGLLLLVLAVFEKPGAVALLALAAALTQREFYQLLDRMDRNPRSRLGIALGLALILAAPYLPRSDFPGELAALYLSLLVCSVAAVFSRHATRPVDALSSTFLGILLIPFAFAHLLLLVQAFPDSLEGLYLGLCSRAWLSENEKWPRTSARPKHGKEPPEASSSERLSA